VTETNQLDAAEKELFRDNFKKFLDKEVAPYYQEWEKAELYPRELWSKFGENGFLAVDVPEAYGGFGASYELSCLVLEEVGRAGFTGLLGGLTVHSDICAPYIFHLGSEEQKEYWLPKLVSGEVVAAIGMTEPNAGSDLQNMRTTAIRNEKGFSISGQKTFISNGQHCDLLILAAKTDPKAGAKGMSLFLLDCSLNGFSRGRNLEKLGHHCADTSELFFDNVQVSEKDILGGEGKGFANLMNELPRERLALGVGAVGAAKGVLARCIEYVTERKAFGQSISQFQNTRFKLAELRTEIELNEALVEKYIKKYEQGELSAVEASMIKLSSTEMQGRVADECLQLYGGYGYMQEYDVSRAYVDARIQRIYGGTSEIMKEIIARDLVGR
jgi:alkylation response protein AidB-like acyl-CoA dehydrogenase